MMSYAVIDRREMAETPYFTPDRIRTCDLRFRKPLLCPAELRGRLEFFEHQV